MTEALRLLLSAIRAPRDVKFTLHNGDCLDVLRTMPENSVDSIVTDPPYGLSFMGKKWDYDVPSEAIWRECLRVLKPGGHLLAFAGTRTQHRMAVRIEDAGFEIRDLIAWVYGSGFPKSLDVSKAIDKARDDSADILRVTTFMADAAELIGANRADVNAHMGTSGMGGWWLSRLQHRCQCPKWDQWLRLKQFLRLSDEMDAEVWRLNGRKGQPGEAWADREFYDEPTGGLHGGSGNTVGAFTGKQAKPGGVLDAARQWQGWGTALKPALEPITVARKPLAGTVAENVLQWGCGGLNIDGCRVEAEKATGWGGGGGSKLYEGGLSRTGGEARMQDGGRWPANLIHDGSGDVLAGFPEGNSRFFYCAKVSKKDRDEGLDGFAKKSGGMVSNTSGQHMTRRDEGYEVAPRANNHPTVKPTDLMRYLARLVTPPGGVVLDPFMGSGSTGKAAMLEGFRFIGIERDEQYMGIARARIGGAL